MKVIFSNFPNNNIVVPVKVHTFVKYKKKPNKINISIKRMQKKVAKNILNTNKMKNNIAIVNYF